MAHWMCTTCGYYLQSSAPPDRCPSCEQICAFSDVTCYRPECGGEQNIDPLVVGSTLRILKGVPKPSGKPEPPLPSSKAIPLVEILTGHNINDKEDLEQLSFWAISQLEILRGLSKQQRQQLKSLGRIEHYEPDAVIFTEGTEARKFYLVEEGRVAVESQVARGMRFPISIVYPGQAFGWSALVPPYMYTATVMALSGTRVISIDQEALLAMIRADPALGFIIMQNVACIVASRLRTVELALAGLFQQGR
jgi:CRP/FNR family transcriptional regulator, cyclic AMP receptor protein